MSEVLALACGVIVAAFEGRCVPADSPRFGGYVLFARNGTSARRVRALTDELRGRDAGQAPLIAIDQEGGRVVRLRDGVEPMPAMMALGATGDAALAERAGEQIAFDLRRAGCALDFAPVLDLALDPANTVIGTRSFGDDPATVTSLAQAVARGLERGGVVACYKHFPGHGATAVDSHVALPTIETDETTLRARDWHPFAAVARGAQAMMVGHVRVRALDARLPATISGRVVGALREELGFRGTLFTDALEMGAIAGQVGTAAGAVAALAAGCDALTIASNPEAALEAAHAIQRAVQAGDVPIERLREAHARVLRLRQSAPAPLPLDAPAPHPGIGREIARRAVTLIRGAPHAEARTSVVVSFEIIAAEGAEEVTAAASLQREATALESLAASIDPDPDEVSALLAAVARSGRRSIVLTRRAHLYPRQARAVDRLLERDPEAIVVSMREPFDLPLFARARHVLVVYGDDRPTIGGLADALFGGLVPQGKLPVRVGLDVG